MRDEHKDAGEPGVMLRTPTLLQLLFELHLSSRSISIVHTYF
jgi:hypothetical protein